MAEDSADDRISQLQAELDHLKQHLDERDIHISNYESEFIKYNMKNTELEGQVSTWREKYERLYEAHKRVQRVNQNLEDKVLDMVEKCKVEKTQLTKDIATLSVRLAESKQTVAQLQSENERYKNDMTLAIQLLQCKPDNFVMPKFETLPPEMQNRVATYVTTKSKTSPTSVKSNNNVSRSRSGSIDEKVETNEYEFSISASLMSKILEDSIHDTITKHCDSCNCSKENSNPFSYGETHYTVATQTQLHGNVKSSFCLNCNGDIKSLNSNLSVRSESPLAVKIFNNGNDSLSEKEKSSPVYLIRLGNTTEPAKNGSVHSVEMNGVTVDHSKSLMSLENKSKLVAEKHREIIGRIGTDLRELTMKSKFTVDPITGHHRLCDRTKSIQNTDDVSLDSPIAVALTKSDLNLVENTKSRKTSLSSNDAGSKASSTGTHKSNTHVGPGPRFCSLRVQAGSKNILLDNAQPDVPPVLYTRQSKQNDNLIAKDAEAETDDKNPFDSKVETESTLNEKHVLDFSVPNDLNILSLLPIPPNPEPKKSDDVIIFINDDKITDVNENNSESIIIPEPEVLPINNQGIKMFNFDSYEKETDKFEINRKVDMAQLNHMQNTKIPKLPQFELSTELLDKNYNVNLASKHFNEISKNMRHKIPVSKIGKTDKKITKTDIAEKSTSSISSEDSATVLQKQQLIRVAEWVQKNIELSQKEESSPSAETHESFGINGDLRQIRKIKNPECFNKLDGLPLKMPHPVTKYCDAYLDNREKTELEPSKEQPKPDAEPAAEVETPTPNLTTVDKSSLRKSKSVGYSEDSNSGTLTNGKKDLSQEELARMEYNVKQFLLKGSNWSTNVDTGLSRIRRTSSHTETDL